MTAYARRRPPAQAPSRRDSRARPCPTRTRRDSPSAHRTLPCRSPTVASSSRGPAEPGLPSRPPTPSRSPWESSTASGTKRGGPPSAEREYASPLAKRPYDLRHAAVSTCGSTPASRHSGRRVGRSQRGRAAAGLRQVHRTVRTRQPGAASKQRLTRASEARPEALAAELLPRILPQTAVDEPPRPVTNRTAPTAP